jgi:acetolactate synthase small subunit
MSSTTSTDPTATACFYVHAVAEPGVMPRVLNLFAKRGLIPAAWHSTLGGPRGDELHIDIQVADMATADAEYIARCLRQIAYVEAVLTSEKGYAMRA